MDGMGIETGAASTATRAVVVAGMGDVGVQEAQGEAAAALFNSPASFRIAPADCWRACMLSAVLLGLSCNK